MQKSRVTDNPEQTSLLGGKVQLLQPESGFRTSSDAVFLAAAVPAKAGDKVLDIGCGVGAAGFCVAARVDECHVTGLEIEEDIAELARQGLELNAFKDRFQILTGNLLNSLISLQPGSFDHVLANPPYMDTGTVSPHPHRAISMRESHASLADWVNFAIKMAKPRGTVTFIHRADRVDELISLMSAKLGGIIFFPLWPKAGQEAKRVIIQGRRDVKTPAKVCAGLVVHQDNGDYTSEAENILRQAKPLTL